MNTNHEKENRSSAFTPEELGSINVAMNAQIAEMAKIFSEREPVVVRLADKQFELLSQVVQAAVTESIKKGLASLQS